MTDGVVIEARGAAELQRTLRKASDDLGNLSGVNQSAGSMVAAAARGRAPHRSGALAASIRASRVAAGSVTVVAGVPYAGPIHWGWPARNIAARPFLSDAATSTESAWVALYEAELNRVIDRVEGA